MGGCLAGRGQSCGQNNTKTFGDKTVTVSGAGNVCVRRLVPLVFIGSSLYHRSGRQNKNGFRSEEQDCMCTQIRERQAYFQLSSLVAPVLLLPEKQTQKAHIYLVYLLECM